MTTTAASVQSSAPSNSQAILDGYYINLDAASERNALMQEQIRQYGLGWIARI
jgi:hypothetical protein